MAHTKGPWKVSDDEIVSSPDDQLVASLSAGYSTIDDVDERAANGRLMAAAPDMLEALKIFVDGPESRFMPGYRFALDAIAKAEGS